MTQAKRRLTDINFDFEGAHVALVGKHQGGPANGVTTLITKATNQIDPAKAAEAVAQDETTQLETGDTTVEQIEKAVHEELLAKAVEEAVAVEKAAGAEALALVQKALEDQAEVLKAAQDKIAEFEQAEAEAVTKSRHDRLAAVLPADQVEGIQKALASLDEEAFAASVAGYAVLKAAADNSDMMQETGVAGTGAEDSAEVDRTRAILLKKYKGFQAK